MRKQNIFYALLFFGFIFLIFRNWVFVSQIIGGDWPFVFQERINETSLILPSWDPLVNNGLGGTSSIYSLGSFQYLIFFISTALNIPWVIVYKIFWFGSFLLLSSISTFYLFDTVFPGSKFWQKIIGTLIYITNTYILMLTGGGQMGVVLAYSLIPLVFASFVRTINHTFSNDLKRTVIIRSSLLSAVAIATQIIFDPRITYLTVLAIGLYLTLQLIYRSKVEKNGESIIIRVLHLFIYVFFIPGMVTVALHAAWIIPLIVSRISPMDVVGNAYTGTEIVKFLSFAYFSNSLSLLHPNWPENIFGKIGFMKPEFLVLPILAFSSLLSSSKTKDQKIKSYIIYFALLGLIGAFLAKGANPPFGGIYLWLFEYVPGFVMFRDPTKFYLLVILSYSILIPFSLAGISDKFIKIKPYKFAYILPLVFMIFWLATIRQAVFGQLGGTFSKHDVPQEYIELKDFLYNQKEYFRTLWVPRQQRFSFVSNIHPAIEAELLFGTRNAEELSKKISNKKVQSLLSELSVKYILIQYDSLGEQFVKDGKYSEKYRTEYEKKLDTIPLLKKIRNDKITVYEMPFKDHFILDKSGKVSTIMINPMHYILTVSVDSPQNLIFSESFNSYWILTENDRVIHSIKTENGLNSFWLERQGKYRVNVSFSLEKYYQYGRIVSLLTITLLIICFAKLKK